MSTSEGTPKKRKLSPPPSNFGALPFDILQPIFSFCPRQTLYCLRLVCRFWNDALLQGSDAWCPHVRSLQQLVFRVRTSIQQQPPTTTAIAPVIAATVRKPFVGGNWKCNGTIASIRALTTAWNSATVGNHADIVIGIPAILTAMTQSLLRPDFQLASENCYPKSGAFTGETSVAMLQDWGLKWCIIGHSERRKYFHETDPLLAEKTKACLLAGINVIGCIGETLAQRKAGITFPVNFRQLDSYISAIGEIGMEKWDNFVLAYEPVWAIGTGVVATPDQAQEVHLKLRARIAEKVGPVIAGKVRIIYGGSVKTGNCQELYRKADVDGFLVGGASLQPSFTQIINSTARKIFIAGYVGGVCGITVGHPLDTIKVRLQISHRYEAFRTMLWRTLKNERVFGLFKGLQSPVLSEGINDFNLFGVYGMVKNSLAPLYFPDAPNYSPAKFLGSVFLASSIGGLSLTQTATVTDLIKIQLQSDFQKRTERSVGRRGFVDCIKHIVKTHGVRRLWHGYCITMFSSWCYAVGYFVTYELMKQLMARKVEKTNDIHNLGSLSLMMSGGCAGIMGWVCCYPSDYFKSKVQADLKLNFRTILRTETFTAAQVLNGLGVVILRAFPVHAITFYMYEKVMKVIAKD